MEKFVQFVKDHKVGLTVAAVTTVAAVATILICRSGAAADAAEAAADAAADAADAAADAAETVAEAAAGTVADAI